MNTNPLTFIGIGGRRPSFYVCLRTSAAADIPEIVIDTFEARSELFVDVVQLLQ